MTLLKYERMRPDELARVWQARPLAICPWGALEWHGPHLPLGLDGIVAERFCEALAERTGGVLLPTTWHPITTLPHPMSLQIRTEVFRGLVQDLVDGLYGAGARVVCLVTGHYAQGHEIELYRSARAAMDTHTGLQVLAATPLELLGDDDLLDHAGRYETAQLAALEWELVDTEALPRTPLLPHQVSVLGSDPREGTPAEGAELLKRGQKAWEEWVQQMLMRDESKALRQFYDRREESYRPYVDRYFRGSWEQAIQDWWADQ